VIEFLLATDNLPFTAALGVMLVIGVMEAVGLMFGADLASAVDSVLPDFDLDADLDVEGGAAPGPLAAALGWLCVGKVPALILLICFLLAFGLAGLGVQSLVLESTGALLPGWFAAIPALAIGLPATRFLGLGFAKILPQDETYAVSESEFLGKVATVTMGTARAGLPAEAKLRDAHGNTHYVRVEPLRPADSFAAGTAVVLKARDGAVYKVDAA
jgi:hypothetical protein